MLRLLLILIMLLPAYSFGSTTSIKSVRTWAGPDHTRVVFDLTGAVEHSLFTLKGPDRVVIDLRDASVAQQLVKAAKPQGLVRQIRAAAHDRNDLRVVLDLSGGVRVKSFAIKPEGSAGHRLVVDLREESATTAQAAPPKPVKTSPAFVQRDLVIAIDAGHGGADPGAVGPRGTYEKTVVLAVAKKLAQLVEKEPGMTPLMIRDRDVLIPLRDRKEKARKHGADMFLSIHADSVARTTVQGASVYTLSRHGASTEAAKLLAERENSADLVGGVSLDDRDDLVASVILDLSRAANSESSVSLAKSLLQQLGTVGKLHKTSVEHAGFMVLKSLDMPSVLVELAFISNPIEERRLADDAHQWRLARALLAGVRSYRDQNPPLMPRYVDSGGQEYIVKAGDTLSAIAQKHEVSVDRLRSANQLNGDMLMVGHTLRIP